MLAFGLTESLFVIILGALVVLKWFKSEKHLPPGPRGFPVVGNAFQMMNNWHLKMSEWAKEYGSIYKIQLGINTTIILNDLKLIKEVMNDNNFSVRPQCYLFELMSGGPYGIINTNGQAWEEQRRWTLRKLRDFGFGKTSMEGMIMDEVNEVIDIIETNGSKPMKLNLILDLAVLNALWTLANGERKSLTDPELREVLNAHHRMPEVIAESGLMFAPWLKYIFPNSKKKAEMAGEKLMDYSRKVVAKHWDTYKDGVSRDFIDEYISEIKNTTDLSSSFYGDTGRKHLEAIIGDIINAGGESTSHTLSWLLSYVTEYPEIQKQIQREIAQAFGDSKQIGLGDKTNMPYTEATILETMRYSSLLPAGVQRSAIEDKEVAGHIIPKGCWIFPNLYYINNDADIWGDPEVFRPERFLSPDGKKVVRNDALMPFQTGRRQCLGEGLARDTIFLFTANLLQKFSIERVEKEKPQITHAGLLLLPKAYNYIFTPK